MPSVASKKVTISLPADLVSYADRIARQRKCTRSAVFYDLLEEQRVREREDLAREGYRFYAQEAEEFAAASQSAVAEALENQT